jgi:bifunctional non-homologous end joining protein LigD
VAFGSWTRDGRIRHASFQGIREDKPASKVRREAEQVWSGASAAAEDDDVIAGIELSSPDKVLFPKQGITKRQLARYYETVADRMLPHVVGRPLMLLRCPQGRQRKCFVQRHPGEGMPEGIVGVPIEEKDGTSEHVAIEGLAGLIRLVQLGVLEIHPWGSRRDAIDRPDRLVLDLDPAENVPFQRVVEAALETRELLRHLGLESFVKTTGGKGLHVVVPLLRRDGWDEVKSFARGLAEHMVERDRERYTARMRKSARTGKIFIDHLRNDRGATAVAPYSSRAREGGPVALPLSWNELTPDLDPQAFTVATVPELVRRREADPWSAMTAVRQSITKHAMRALSLGSARRG